MEGIVANFSQQQRRPTIPDILFTRQLGLNPHRREGTTATRLDCRIAWSQSRMQNMVLTVGPGTPAAVCMVNPSSSISSSSGQPGEGRDNLETDDDADEEPDGDEDKIDDSSATNRDEMEGGDRNPCDDDENSCGTADWMRTKDGEEDERIHRAQEIAENALMEWMDSDGDESEDDDDVVLGPARNGHLVPSLRHGGCINTAAWLTSPWRLSLSGSNGETVTPIYSEECPTQLITSGDDRLVKFWDVRYAMGTSNPLAGGKDTVCPFSSEIPLGPPTDTWRDLHLNFSIPISGSVIPLCTLQTGHRGNVFHVTPLDHEPGKVVTCGADGYLRCGDINSGMSSVIVAPEFDRETMDLLRHTSLRPGMCFSHHFVDAYTGLLCSERGLRRFDIRLNPREQQRRSMLSNEICKACAIWSKDSDESAYVFAGGASANVALYDLRMVSDGGPMSKAVQVYRPRDLSEDAPVSVSGIDISKNKKELLVSYENDQIYTFPICPNAKCAAGPSVDELLELANDLEENGNVQRELCAYGGHLNRYTFLKNAKYAGPADEYICTGSDSGHAWIYEKSTGTVVSLLNADNSTCNGVIPHPTLPIFITYGIDSTAKLWRATIPVGENIDDSPLGRSKFYHSTKQYNRTQLVSSWADCQSKLTLLSEEEDDIFVMPDEIPPTEDLVEGGLFGGLSSAFFRIGPSRISGRGSPYIGNDLKNLPRLLRENLFACILSHDGDKDDPVRSAIHELKRRISLMCLKHQADERGLLWNPDTPWRLEARRRYVGGQMTSAVNGDSRFEGLVSYGDPVDLIPTAPSNWLPYDPKITNTNLGCSVHFNLEDYEEYYRRYYTARTNVESSDIAIAGVAPLNTECPTRNKRKLDSQDVDELVLPTPGEDYSTKSLSSDCAPAVTPDKTGVGTQQALDRRESALNLLHDTIAMLKDSGNKALQAGLPSLAARRYDQAIQYCAVIFMRFPKGNLDLLVAQWDTDPRLEWTPLLKLLITTRLNLSMVLLKLVVPQARKACEIASTALVELGPFVIEKGQICRGRKFTEVFKDDEPESTYLAAKELQAKAFFRLGSAQYEMGDFSEAVRSFEHSITSITSAQGQPETIVLRRLEEAKHASKRKAKNLRKKFKAAFGDKDDGA